MTPLLGSHLVDVEPQDNDVEDVGKLSPEVVAPKWLQPNDVDVVVLNLTTKMRCQTRCCCCWPPAPHRCVVDEVCMLWAQHLVVVVVDAQLPLPLAIVMSSSLSLSWCFLNLMMNDEPG